MTMLNLSKEIDLPKLGTKQKKEKKMIKKKNTIDVKR
jgi:hypothetical protein